jgi:hypothetical protein
MVTLYLPSGQAVTPPVDPRTWVEKSGSTRGDPLRAKYIEKDIAGAVAWHRARPLFQAWRSTTKSIATSAWTPVELDTEMIDTVQGHSDTTNTGRWFAPVTANTLAGNADIYLATGYVPYNTSDAANVFIAGLLKQGESAPREGATMPRPAGHDVTLMVAELFSLTAGQYIELNTWHNHGSNATVPASTHVANMTVRWVGSSTGLTVAMPSAPRTWTAADDLWADSSGGAKVPLNTEWRDRLRFWNYPPYARLTSETSAQTIPSGATTWTAIQFPTQNLDSYTGWATGTNTRYTCKRAGLYLIYGQAALTNTNAGAGTFVAARIRHTIAAGGTADYYGGSTIPPTTATTGTTVPASGFVRMAVNDYVELQASHNLGASKTVKSGSKDACRMLALWVAR